MNPTTAGSAASAPGSSTGQAAGLNQLDNSQTFLKLLVAQLKNQNPDNPTDPTSFMTEIAQLTAVQSQTSLNAEEQTVAADSMIGRTVSGNGSDGKAVSGTVTGVLLSSSGAPQLQLSASPGDPTATTSIALDAVTRVYQATSPSPTSTSTSTVA
ncbi:MAG TPA: flagellar hook capping FlgD N-terminal domain-containing protein [Acidimicrobiales bacterium]|nr:flagellar hook capping FlgD N-terminal domain-containing protein [Acidimicrobiales bacterium]